MSTRCFRCGRNGHWASDCYAKTTLFRSELLKPQPTSDCFRCGRSGHWADDCFARRDIDGNRLGSAHDDQVVRDCFAKTTVFHSGPPKPQPTSNCFRCGRNGHWDFECFARRHMEGNTPVSAHDDQVVRRGVYVLEYPNGNMYVGKSNNIDERIRQHVGQGVSCTIGWGRPREIPTITPRLDQDHESWERNETLERMQLYGIERVRGWMYTTSMITEEEEESIQSQLCEKYDLCRFCGRKGHFASACPESKGEFESKSSGRYESEEDDDERMDDSDESADDFENY